MGAKKDLTGQRFGRLTVVCDTGERKRGYIVWRCKCDCGNTHEVIGNNLLRGSVKSCGCLIHDVAKENIKNTHKSGTENHSFKHGMSHSRLYRIWLCMRRRCYDERNIGYKYYGGRGIGVCDEWRNSFEAFRDWALANGYRDDLTIDRIDVNGNYEPLNCRWTDISTQLKNRRKWKRAEQSKKDTE